MTTVYKIVTAHRVGEGAWKITLSNGALVEVPAANLLGVGATLARPVPGLYLVPDGPNWRVKKRANIDLENFTPEP
jgi:hypothetical protein